jgi:DNA repair ATPase RecN
VSVEYSGPNRLELHLLFLLMNAPNDPPLGVAANLHGQALTELDKAVLAEAPGQPAFRSWQLAVQELAEHRRRQTVASATIDELTARRRRLEISNEPGLAARLREIDRSLDEARKDQADAAGLAETLGPVVQERRKTALQELTAIVKKHKDLLYAQYSAKFTTLLEKIREALPDELLQTIVRIHIAKEDILRQYEAQPLVSRLLDRAATIPDPQSALAPDPTEEPVPTEA